MRKKKCYMISSRWGRKRSNLDYRMLPHLTNHHSQEQSHRYCCMLCSYYHPSIDTAWMEDRRTEVEQDLQGNRASITNQQCMTFHSDQISSDYWYTSIAYWSHFTIRGKERKGRRTKIIDKKIIFNSISLNQVTTTGMLNGITNDAFKTWLFFRTF